MKHSIRLRLIIVSTALFLLTIVSFSLINRIFLVDYYQYTKVNMLGAMFEEVNKVYTGEDVYEESDEVTLALERLGSKQNVNLYIYEVYYIGNFINFMYKYPLLLNDMQEEQLKRNLEIYYVNDLVPKEEEITKLTDEENYEVYKHYDKRIRSNYIELIGILDNGDYIYIRTNFESIQNNANISNQFFSWVGMLVTILGIFLMSFVSKNFTTPILQLAEIAKKMSNLEFGIKYPVRTQDEIGVLGSSINSLSEKLETTISELKSANNELQKDIEKKVEVDEMRKEFLSNVSHELKTPIALIQGYAEGLKENINEDPENRNFYCEVIIDEAMKMNQMVKKLLTLNQIEFGNQAVNFSHFDIVELIKSVLTKQKILFEQKEARLIFETNEPIYVWADEYSAEEVLTNYLTNALNHVEKERIICVKLIQKETVVRISVFNTGEAIPDEDITNIWEKFYKVDKSRTREYGGSGIGLSIVKAVMESMNQQYGVQNHDNGVEFWFELDIRNLE